MTAKNDKKSPDINVKVRGAYMYFL